MLCFMTMLALVSCGDDFCQHRDADDDLECDYCNKEYIDGKDVEDGAPCARRVRALLVNKAWQAYCQQEFADTQSGERGYRQSR